MLLLCQTSGRRHGGMLEPPAVMSCPAEPAHGFAGSLPGPFPPSPSSAMRLAYSESKPPRVKAIDDDPSLDIKPSKRRHGSQVGPAGGKYCEASEWWWRDETKSACSYYRIWCHDVTGTDRKLQKLNGNPRRCFTNKAPTCVPTFEKLG